MTPGAEAGGYDLTPADASLRRTSAAWLTLGLVALFAAGVFSLLLVLARTPRVQDWLPLADFFHVALVVHVNLSVLIWLLAMAGAMWSLSCTRAAPTRDRISFWVAAAGAAVVAGSPFVGASEPLLNNYVPVLRHPAFFTGLALFVAGIGLHLIRTLVTGIDRAAPLAGDDALRHGIRLSALVTGIAIAAFGASLAAIPPAMAGQVYFEFLFWGAGHVLQFNHTLMMAIAWIVLAAASGGRFVLSPRLTLVFLLLVALPVITVPFLYLAHEVVSPGHRLAFTELMQYGGLSCLPLGLAVLVSLWQAGTPAAAARPLRAALEASILLFTVGGVLGFMIAGLDIVIPAHYHGSTVGVTLALMGLCYYLLPRLGFAPPPRRLATWQPYVYGGGQLLHILGLAWTGGYGVQRKAAGAAEGVDRLGEVAGMGLMGLGGLVSVIGGVMFLIAAYLSMRPGRRR